jgi:acyl-CoA thioester hydrolase
MALHIDMVSRRVAPFPEEQRAALEAAVAKYAPAELPKGTGRRIAMPKLQVGA